jgi:hypothetical protein
MKRKQDAIERDREGSGDMKETELYESVKGYFTTLGFTVRAEVRDIDICAVRDDLLVGIELKRNFSTDLLIQAVLRQKVCDLVYIAVPKPKRVRKDRSFRNMLHMLSRLELGLLYVDIVTGHVVEVLEPTFYDLDKARKTMMKSRRSILSEIKRRTLDGNVGGSNKTRLLTAYREESLKTIALIRHKGVISPKDLKEIGIRPGLLNNNFYGWFRKLERGRYGLEEKKAEDYAEYEVYIEGFHEAFRIADDKAQALSEDALADKLRVQSEGTMESARAAIGNRKKRAAATEPVRESMKEETGRPESPDRTKKASMKAKVEKTPKPKKAPGAVTTPKAVKVAKRVKAVSGDKSASTAVPAEKPSEGQTRKKRKTVVQAESPEE